MTMPNLESGVRRIVDKNVALMRSMEDGGMMSFGESVGRSIWQGLPWNAYNFYFDKDSGEIAYFHTSGDKILEKEEETQRNFKKARFNVAFDIANEKEGVWAIRVEDKECPGALVLGLTALAYNKKYGLETEIQMIEGGLDLR